MALLTVCGGMTPLVGGLLALTFIAFDLRKLCDLPRFSLEPASSFLFVASAHPGRHRPLVSLKVPGAAQASIDIVLYGRIPATFAVIASTPIVLDVTKLASPTLDRIELPLIKSRIPVRAHWAHHRHHTAITRSEVSDRVESTDIPRMLTLIQRQI